VESRTVLVGALERYFRPQTLFHGAELFSMERRQHSRHNAQTTVYIQIPGSGGKVCCARNLSANGAFVETENLGLRKGTLVALAFAVTEGRVTRIHRRTAVVVHVTQGGTGLRVESLAAS
jgi:hypothetical protein